MIEVPAPVLVALRDLRLRRAHADRVYAELWASLSPTEARVAKVHELAEILHVGRREVRRALDRLARCGYLAFSHRDTNGRRYYWRIDKRRGAHGTPVASPTANAA